MSTTLQARAPSALTSFARNVTRSHPGWQVTVRADAPERRGSEALVGGAPLRRLALEGEDLVVEFGNAPGRPRRLTLTGPLELSAGRHGLALEIRLSGPRGATHVIELAPPATS